MRVLISIAAPRVNRDSAVAVVDRAFFDDTLLAKSQPVGTDGMPDSAQLAMGFTTLLVRGTIAERGPDEIEVCLSLNNLLLRNVAGPDRALVRREKLDSALTALARRYGSLTAARKQDMSSLSPRCQ